jgi:hypothetical protein
MVYGKKSRTATAWYKRAIKATVIAQVLLLTTTGQPYRAMVFHRLI